MLIPSFSLGNPAIPAEVYSNMRQRYLAEFEANEGDVKGAFNPGSSK